jgi:hypothetical protein
MKKILLITAAALLFGCAEERPINTTVGDFDKSLDHDKSVFTGAMRAGIASGSQAPKNWIYKTTAVKTSTNDGFAFVGLQGDVNIGYFKFTENHMQLFNAINTQGQGDASSVPSLLDQWKISHRDYKLDDSTGRVSNNEVLDNDLHWSKRRFFQIDFEDSSYSSIENGCWKRVAARLVDGSRVVRPDYMTYVVAMDYEPSGRCGISIRRQNTGDYTYTVHWRYSFKPYKKTSYKPFVYQGGRNDKLLDKFGYFNTKLEYLDKRSGRFNTALLMNRWDPEKTHTFYFSEEFPEKYKWIFHDIFNKTNKLFSDNGLKLRFLLKENNDGGKVRKLGDIRYSFVNVVTERDPNAPLGYGPSDADPLTGELFAANLHMYTGFLNTYISRLKTSYDWQPKKFEESTLYSKMKEDLEEEDPSKWYSKFEYGTNKPGTIFNDILMEKTYGFPGWTEYSRGEDIEAEDLFSFSRANQAVSLFKEEGSDTTKLQKLLQKGMANVDKYVQAEIVHAHESGHCKYPVHHHMADAQKLIIDGANVDDVMNTIFYRTAIHELGHNLNLRHNFYGSVDAKNFGAARKAIDTEGNEVEHKPYTSSVMEYLRLQEKIHLDHRWEPYDEAALLYAYSGGKIDSAKNFLFCTDQHRVLNAMCATWDYGSSPSEAIFSHIETYEDLYAYLNFRNDRGYWNARGYDSRMFSTMWAIKKFYMMYQEGYAGDGVEEEVNEIDGLKPYEKAEIIRDIDLNFEQSIKLALTFYNSVLAQKSTEKDWMDEREERSAELKRVGTASDKIYAMLFLAGDSGFMYNPNRNINYSTYLNLLNHPRLAPLATKMFENVVNSRVDMEQGFLGFGRSLFAMNATNFYNRDDLALINKIAVERFDARDLDFFFGIKANEIPSGETRKLTMSNHPDFGINEDVAIVRVGGFWYISHRSNNPYIFIDMQNIIENEKEGRNVADSKRYLQDLYGMYKAVTR